MLQTGRALGGDGDGRVAVNLMLPARASFQGHALICSSFIVLLTFDGVRTSILFTL